ncbi:MAG: hypothetical protein MJ168_11415 [Clostridia bacterium]|nr:hypothetical protein [Clostridia bacterium]
MRLKNEKMPKGYAIMWGIFTAAYAIWMTFFMNKIVLIKYATEGSRTVDEMVDGVLAPVTHTDITGMIGREWLYPVWVVVSVICMALFAVYIKKYLYSPVGKGAKAFSLIALVFGCAFITWYGFLKDPTIYTASMIGLDFPWEFRGWGVFSTLAVFTNVMLMYNKFDYKNRLGVISGSVGCAALFITINVPSFGEELVLTSLRCMSHWVGALVFAFAAAAPVVMFLFSMAFKRKNKKFIVVFFAFSAILAAMLVLLVAIGKDGLIENLPMWAVYVVLFLINYTSIFDEKKAPEKEKIAA